MYLTLNSSFNVKLNRLRLCDGIYFSKILRRARPLPPGPAHTTPRHLSPTYPSTYPVDNIFNCFFLSFKILSLSLPPLSSTRTLLTYCILSLSLSLSLRQFVILCSNFNLISLCSNEQGSSAVWHGKGLKGSGILTQHPSVESRKLTTCPAPPPRTQLFSIQRWLTDADEISPDTPSLSLTHPDTLTPINSYTHTLSLSRERTETRSQALSLSLSSTVISIGILTS